MAAISDAGDSNLRWQYGDAALVSQDAVQGTYNTIGVKSRVLLLLLQLLYRIIDEVLMIFKTTKSTTKGGFKVHCIYSCYNLVNKVVMGGNTCNHGCIQYNAKPASFMGFTKCLQNSCEWTAVMAQ